MRKASGLSINQVYVGLGSNVGDDTAKRQILLDALQRLNTLPGCSIKKVSSLYKTAPFGGIPQPDFYNAVLALDTSFPPDCLLKELKQLETELGRQKRERWGPRELDLDILLFGDQSVTKPGLTIPHPGLLERSFVLIPLLEIALEVRLPNGRPIKQAADAALLIDPEVQRIADLDY